MKTKQAFIAFITTLLFALAVPAGISAHDMWLEMKDFTVKNNSAAVCTFAWGHDFPSSHNETVPRERMAPSYLLSPGGAMVRLVPGENGAYRSAAPLSQPGSYLAVSGKRWTCWVKTTAGYVEGKNKAQAAGALRGINSGKFCKAVITVDAPGGAAFSRVVGHELEIVPLRDPGTLDRGDALPVRVLFKGRPAEVEVKATYDGYSRKENVFAVTVKTDVQGRAEIPISKSGKWLIRTAVTEKPADTRLYDEKAYAATLTFQTR